MCGIAGLIGRISTPNRSAVARINAALAHRGPDGTGLWESGADADGRGVILGHRRLSILDLSDSGSQPMIDGSSGDAIVFNGEVYNFRELRSQLDLHQSPLSSSGDTAVILRSLSIHGEEAICTFRGMFAFAHWNVRQRTLTLARDHFGIKPLYYARNPRNDEDWSLIFASELRALLASGLLSRPRLNPAAVASMVWNGFTVTPETMVAGVGTIWPSQWVRFDSHGHEKSSQFYWDISAGRNPPPVAEPDIPSLLENTVRAHLVSDVPVSVFLSSGVDSSVVANLAQHNTEGQINTFTLAFEEPEFNEGRIAKRIATAIGSRHHEVPLTEREFIDNLETALNSLDQPTFDGINSFYISRAVRDAGYKVALVGTGGDELFGGYQTFRTLPQMLTWSRLTQWLPLNWRRGVAQRFADLIRPATNGFPQQTRWAKLPDIASSEADLVSLYQISYSLFTTSFQKELLAVEPEPALVDGLPRSMRARFSAECGTPGGSALAHLSDLEERLFLGERLLRDTDATSMASSIEIRLPLVDPILHRGISSLSRKVRFETIGSKGLLRRAGLNGLDPALFARPKSGFVLPYDRWIRSRLGGAMSATMHDTAAAQACGLRPAAVRRLWNAFLEGAPGVYWSRVWAIFVLIRWCQQHSLTI